MSEEKKLTTEGTEFTEQEIRIRSFGRKERKGRKKGIFGFGISPAKAH